MQLSFSNDAQASQDRTFVWEKTLIILLRRCVLSDPLWHTMFMTTDRYKYFHFGYLTEVFTSVISYLTISFLFVRLCDSCSFQQKKPKKLAQWFACEPLMGSWRHFLAKSWIRHWKRPTTEIHQNHRDPSDHITVNTSGTRLFCVPHYAIAAVLIGTVSRRPLSL